MVYLPLQIIVTLFIVIVVFRLINKFKENLLKISEFLGWLLIWLLVLVAFWLPWTTSYLAKLLGIGRGVDLAIYVAILILFYLVFRIYLRLDNQRKDLTKIVRELGLKNQDNKSSTLRHSAIFSELDFQDENRQETNAEALNKVLDKNETDKK